MYEFIYESFIDNQEDFLEISDSTMVVHAFGMNWENDSFIFVARNAKDDMDTFEEIDVNAINKTISDTTPTMYNRKRYIDLTKEQVEDIQNR